MIELPTLYARGHSTKMLQWRTWNEDDITIFEYGIVGGKLIVQRDRQAATNVGRSNARDGAAQAQFVCKSAWEHKLKEGYYPSMEEAQTAEVLLPMLAMPLFKQVRNSKRHVKIKKAPLTFPCHVQRKLNGLRCAAFVHEDGSVTLKSRQGTDWDTLDHIAKEVARLGHPGDIFDGEIYRFGLSLQVINGLIKNKSDPKAAEMRKVLSYHIYDMAKVGGANLAWENRLEALRGRFRDWLAKEVSAVPWDQAIQWYNFGQYGTDPVKSTSLGLTYKPLTLVGTYKAETENQVAEFSKKVAMAGYEGAIVRHFGYNYLFDQRKAALVKVKNFQDEGFLVQDVIGREWFPAGSTTSVMVVDKYLCQNNATSDTFEVVPRGTMEERQKMWEEREAAIGERLLVRFLERSDKLVPQGNPVGLGFRIIGDQPEEDEDSMWS
jgi:ATP-dependent DNA ligase